MTIARVARVQFERFSYTSHDSAFSGQQNYNKLNFFIAFCEKTTIFHNR